MNPIEKGIQFQKEFNELINHAIHDGAPLPNMILTLDDAKFELRMLLFRLREQQAAKELAGKIIQVGSIPPHIKPLQPPGA
jgi:hypothetical protein